MQAQRDLQRLEASLRAKHPEMFAPKHCKRGKAREFWHPVFQRVYGIRPWEIGRYSLKERRMLIEDIEKNGLGF